VIWLSTDESIQAALSYKHDCNHLNSISEERNPFQQQELAAK